MDVRSRLVVGSGEGGGGVDLGEVGEGGVGFGGGAALVVAAGGGGEAAGGEVGVPGGEVVALDVVGEAGEEEGGEREEVGALAGGGEGEAVGEALLSCGTGGYF